MNFIQKAVAEFREKFLVKNLGDDGNYYLTTRSDSIDMEAFLTQKLEQLAKQKDEEFMELIDIHSFTDAFGDKVVKVESLRNKLQGGEV